MCLIKISDILILYLYMGTPLLSLIIWIESSKYVLLFLGCIIQGPIVTLVGGFLFSLHQFNLLPMYIAIFLGNFTADIMWYLLGRVGTRKFIFKHGHFIGITEEKLKKVESYFNLHHQKILIISKITAGLGFTIIILIVAGIFKVPFKKYFTLILICDIIWVALLLAIGYSFGSLFLVMSTTMKIIFIACIIAIITLGVSFFNKYWKKKIN